MIQVTANGKRNSTTVRIDADAEDALVEASAIVNALYRNLHDEVPELAELFRMFVMTSDDCWKLRSGGERVKIDFRKLK